MLGGEKSAAVESNAAVWWHGIAAFESDVGGEVFIGGTQAIADPGPGAGMSQERKSGVNGEVALGVFIDRRGHGTNHGKFIGTLAEVRENAADFESALSVFPEGEGAGKDLAVVVELGALDFDRHGLSGFLLQTWFGIEGVQMRDAAGHVTENDALGFLRPIESPVWCVGQKASLALVHEAGEGQHTESARTFLEHAASGKEGLISEHR